MKQKSGSLLLTYRKQQLIERERISLGLTGIEFDQYKANEIFDLEKERMENM
jgi:Cdc6-like AAA superfamily ATPase